MRDHDPWGDAFVAVVFAYFAAVLFSMSLHGVGCESCLDWVWWTTERLGDLGDWALTLLTFRDS